MPTLNYTTAVPVARTVSEIQELLVRHSASHVAIGYRDRLPVSVSFTLVSPHGKRIYSLPVDIDAVHHLLLAQVEAGELRSSPPKGGWATPQHAARVAWRVIKDWLEAQLAIIDAQMTTLDCVMLPYLHTGSTDQRTLYEVYRAREQEALEVGS